MRTHAETRSVAPGGFCCRWLPRAALATHVTGSIVDEVTDGSEASAEIIRFHESMGFIVTLLLSVIYPTFQFAGASCDVINSQVAGLGSAFFACSLIAVVADAYASILSILIIFSVYMTKSNDETQHTRSCMWREFRVPYMMWVLGAYSTVLTIVAEAFVRRFHLAEPTADDANEPVTIDDAGVVTIVLVFLVLTCALFATMFCGVAKGLRSGLAFSADTAVEATAERDALRAGKPPWFGNPSAAQLREHLETYMREFGHGVGPFANPNPAHWQRYVMRVMQRQGHGSVSYMASRVAETIFEEKVEAILREARGEGGG
jgi:hypothetical protein